MSSFKMNLRMSSDKIQEQETLSSSGATDGRRQTPSDEREFSNAPYFNFNDGKVKFDTNRVDNANDNYGSASAFLPKSPLIAKASAVDAFVLAGY